MISRNIAYRLWISDINNSNYVKSLGEFEPNYIEFNNKRVSRVNIIAVVISKYETENYSSLTLDDRSSQISAKSWNENKKIMEKANIGDVILLIGRIRQNSISSQLYIHPEIIRKVDEKWMLIRKNELEAEYGKLNELYEAKGQNEERMVIEEIKFSGRSLRNQILNIIDSSNSEEGVSKQELLQKTGSTLVFDAVEELLKEGEIFEVNGKYKLLK